MVSSSRGRGHHAQPSLLEQCKPLTHVSEERTSEQQGHMSSPLWTENLNRWKRETWIKCLSLVQDKEEERSGGSSYFISRKISEGEKPDSLWGPSRRRMYVANEKSLSPGSQPAPVTQLWPVGAVEVTRDDFWGHSSKGTLSSPGSLRSLTPSKWPRPVRSPRGRPAGEAACGPLVSPSRVPSEQPASSAAMGTGHPGRPAPPSL